MISGLSELRFVRLKDCRIKDYLYLFVMTNVRRIAVLFFLLFSIISYSQKIDSIPAEVKKLMQCYPAFVSGYANNHILFKDSSKLLWDDGIKNKSAQALLDKPDLKDMFVQSYTTGELKTPPAKNFDPGRIR